MKKIEEIKLMEVDALQEIAEHIGIVLNDIDTNMYIMNT